MEQMIEQPQPPEGDEATTGTMSPLATVRQYLSTNSAKSTFLRNSGLVVKVTSSKSPTKQNLPARQSDISVLQTQVQSLMDVFLETIVVVEKCCKDMNGFETRLSDIRFAVQEQWRKKVKIVLLHQILQPETLALSQMICASIHLMVLLSARTVNFMPTSLLLYGWNLFCCDTTFMMLPQAIVITTLS